MAEALIEIKLPPTSKEGYDRTLMVTVTDSFSGRPLVKAPVSFTIEGDGTFDAFRQVTAYDAVSDELGQILSQWYEFPRYQPRRELKSIVRASCSSPNAQVRLEDLHAEGSVTRRII